MIDDLVHHWKGSVSRSAWCNLRAAVSSLQAVPYIPLVPICFAKMTKPCGLEERSSWSNSPDS